MAGEKQRSIISFFDRCGRRVTKQSDATTSPLRESEESSAAASSAEICPLTDAEISTTYKRRRLKSSTEGKHIDEKSMVIDQEDSEADADTSLIQSVTSQLKPESIFSTSALTEKVIFKCARTDSDSSGNNCMSQSMGTRSLSLLEPTPVHVKRGVGQKRVLGQYFLELGQPDFILSACEVCGLQYSCGRNEDEEIHKTFHENFLQGAKFKGWKNERIVGSLEGSDRIILVMHGDPPHHYQKLKEITTIMEKEMGLTESSLLHRYCKVYLYISSNRIVGCLVAESIKYAFKVLSEADVFCPSIGCGKQDARQRKDQNDFEKEPQCSDEVTGLKVFCSKDNVRSNTKFPANSAHKTEVIRFGNVKLRRETIQKKSKYDFNDRVGTIFCSEVPTPSVCGVRGIWVSPNKRRMGIATRLLDAMRKTFCMAYVLEPSQCAFSQPTSQGKLLAASYCKTLSFLVYKANDVFNRPL